MQIFFFNVKFCNSALLLFFCISLSFHIIQLIIVSVANECLYTKYYLKKHLYCYFVALKFIFNFFNSYIVNHKFQVIL